MYKSNFWEKISARFFCQYFQFVLSDEFKNRLSEIENPDHFRHFDTIVGAVCAHKKVYGYFEI